VETSKLSREAIMAKLDPRRKRKTTKKPRSNKNAPADISQNDYDEVELDDLDGD